MSTEVVKEAKLEEEPRQCTKKEKLGHAIGVLGHDSMYTLWSTWTTPFLTDILKLPAGFLAFLFGGARFFDAFTDISMGIIADRTKMCIRDSYFIIWGVNLQGNISLLKKEIQLRSVVSIQNAYN